MNVRKFFLILFLCGGGAVLAGATPSEALPYLNGGKKGEQAVTYKAYRDTMEQLFDNSDHDNDKVLTVKDLDWAVRNMDTDKSGWVSREEYRDYAYERADLDKNRKISYDERRKWVAPTHPEVIRQILNCCDADRDSKIVKKEFMQVVRTFFEQLDWNRNRTLSPVETGSLPGLTE